MPAKNHDLHGNVPDSSCAALLIVDMINDLDWDGGDQVLEHALPAARNILALKRRAREAGVPVIYANDNFGRWRSDFREVVEHCLEDGVRGRPLAELLRPDPEDYFVLKPKHSAFFSTTMDTLLTYLGVKRVVVTGIAGDACVTITAMDAFLRDFDLSVPADCTASRERRHNDAALAYMQRVLHADTTAAANVDWPALKVGKSGR